MFNKCRLFITIVIVIAPILVGHWEPEEREGLKLKEDLSFLQL